MKLQKNAWLDKSEKRLTERLKNYLKQRVLR
jgi:hypothetical protein